MKQENKPETAINHLISRSDLQEKAILGNCLTDEKFLVEAISALETVDFERELHKRLFGLMGKMRREGLPVDAITLCDYSKDTNLASHIMDLPRYGLKFKNVAEYIKAIRTGRRERALVAACEAVKASPGDEEARRALKRNLSDLEGVQAGIVSMADVMREYLTVFDNRAVGQTGIVSTGIGGFDRMCNGFQRGAMVTLGGPTSGGKSSLLLRLATHWVRAGVRVLIVSGEMTAIEMADRIVSAVTGIETKLLQSGRASEFRNEVVRVANEFFKWPLWFRVSGKLSVASIDADIERVKPDVVVVDYLQLLRPPPGEKNRVGHYDMVAQELKGMAIERKIVLFTASQFHRGATDKNTGSPHLSDLKESSSIEQASHMVMLIDTSVSNEDTASVDDLAKIREMKSNGLVPVDIILAKNRNGPKGTLRMAFREKTAEFVELDEGTEPSY